MFNIVDIVFLDWIKGMDDYLSIIRLESLSFVYNEYDLLLIKDILL